MRNIIHEMLHIQTPHRQNRICEFVNGEKLSTSKLFVVPRNSASRSEMPLPDYHIINPKLSTLRHIYHQSQWSHFHLKSEYFFDWQWQQPSLQARSEQTSRITTSTPLAIPTTVFAVGTFTTLTCAAMHSRRLQYNAVVTLHHPEEVAFVELQHRKTSFGRRELMHSAVFAEWGWWRG